MLLAKVLVGNIFGNGMICAGFGCLWGAASGSFPKSYGRSVLEVGISMLPGNSCGISARLPSRIFGWLDAEMMD